MRMEGRRGVWAMLLAVNNTPRLHASHAARSSTPAQAKVIDNRSRGLLHSSRAIRSKNLTHSDTYNVVD